MAKKKELTLSGGDLTAARNVVKQVLLNDAFCVFHDDQLGALPDAQKRARLFGVLSDHDSYADATLTGRELKHLRMVTEELRWRVEHEMATNWPYFDGSTLGTVDSKRRARQWTLSLLADVERVEAALEREVGQ
jgi:hypothetical protein